MKLGIIRCMQTEDYCPGTSDFKAIRKKSGAFADVEGDIQRLRIARLGSLWITFDERPWSAQRHQRELMQVGFGTFRVDLSWAGTALPVATWRDTLEAQETLPAHFSEHRL